MKSGLARTCQLFPAAEPRHRAGSAKPRSESAIAEELKPFHCAPAAASWFCCLRACVCDRPLERGKSTAAGRAGLRATAKRCDHNIITTGRPHRIACVINPQLPWEPKAIGAIPARSAGAVLRTARTPTSSSWAKCAISKPFPRPKRRNGVSRVCDLHTILRSQDHRPHHHRGLLLLPEEQAQIRTEPFGVDSGDHHRADAVQRGRQRPGTRVGNHVRHPVRVNMIRESKTFNCRAFCRPPGNVGMQTMDDIERLVSAARSSRVLEAPVHHRTVGAFWGEAIGKLK